MSRLRNKDVGSRGNGGRFAGRSHSQPEGWLGRLLGQKVAPQTYYFCEKVTALPESPNHIRLLSAPGAVFSGGGADTPALCGRKVAWDLHAASLDEVQRLERNWEPGGNPVARVCRECARLYAELA